MGLPGVDIRLSVASRLGGPCITVRKSKIRGMDRIGRGAQASLLSDASCARDPIKEVGWRVVSRLDGRVLHLKHLGIDILPQGLIPPTYGRE